VLQCVQCATHRRRCNTHQRDAEFISAEEHGTLYKKPIGSGQADIYFIVVRAAPFFEENRVWLWRSEDKNRALDRQLIELTGKEVVAKGQLKQLSGNAQGVVPAEGMYLEASGPSFRIVEPGKSDAGKTGTAEQPSVTG
jgi:hypothetical protein